MSMVSHREGYYGTMVIYRHLNLDVRLQYNSTFQTYPESRRTSG